MFATISCITKFPVKNQSFEVESSNDLMLYYLCQDDRQGKNFKIKAVTK